MEGVSLIAQKLKVKRQLLQPVLKKSLSKSSLYSLLPPPITTTTSCQQLTIIYYYDHIFTLSPPTKKVQFSPGPHAVARRGCPFLGPAGGVIINSLPLEMMASNRNLLFQGSIFRAFLVGG